MGRVQTTVAGLAEEGRLRENRGKTQKERKREQCDLSLSILQMYRTGPERFGGIQTSGKRSPLCVTAGLKGVRK